MPPVQLALDIDGTLCDSSALADLFASDVALWHEAVATTDLPPIAAAVEALTVRPACEVILVTARSDSLRAATVNWLGRHFPVLAESALLMRGAEDRRPSWEVKADHLERVRGEHRVVLVDDDPMAGLAVRRDDRWLRAPDEWRLLAPVLRHLAAEVSAT